MFPSLSISSLEYVNEPVHSNVWRVQGLEVPYSHDTFIAATVIKKKKIQTTQMRSFQSCLKFSKANDILYGD